MFESRPVILLTLIHTSHPVGFSYFKKPTKKPGIHWEPRARKNYGATMP